MLCPLVLDSDIGLALISLLRLPFFMKPNVLSFSCCDLKLMNVLVERIYVYLQHSIVRERPASPSDTTLRLRKAECEVMW